MVDGDIKSWEKFLENEKKKFQVKYYTDTISGSWAITDFIILKAIGTGTFGRVALVTKRDDHCFYALKIMDKEQAIKLSRAEYCLHEKRILKSINCPFIIKSELSFKDNCYLYIAMPFVPGGELFSLLGRLKKFPERLAKFYAAQVLLALEYLHYLNIIYRDLKSENLLLGGDGYLKLVDLGLSKIVKTRTYTMCGTPEYVAPEIILSKGYGRAVDWWSFGVLVYELCVGTTPFSSTSVTRIFRSIVEGAYLARLLPSAEARDIVRRLLQVDPSRRLGNLRDGVPQIKAHSWFSKVNWLDILNKNVPPLHKPLISGPIDTSLYDNTEQVSLKICSSVRFEQEFMNF